MAARIPEQWTGELIGEIHNAGLSIKDVAEEAKFHPKYVSQVLHGRAVSPNMEAKMKEAMERLKQRKAPDSNTVTRWTLMPARTLEQIEAMPTEILTCADVAPILGANAETIRQQARERQRVQEQRREPELPLLRFRQQIQFLPRM